MSNDVSLVTGAATQMIDIVAITSNPSPDCNQQQHLTISLTNPCFTGTVINAPAVGDQSVGLNDPHAHIYAPGDFTDSLSTSKGDPTFCGAR